MRIIFFFFSFQDRACHLYHSFCIEAGHDAGVAFIPNHILSVEMQSTQLCCVPLHIYYLLSVHRREPTCIATDDIYL